MWWRECKECGRDFKSSDSVEEPLLCYYCFEEYKKSCLQKKKGKLMYIKIANFIGSRDCWTYNIYSDKNRIVCESAGLWWTQGGAVRAAIKLATDLNIEYRETK